MENLNPYQSPKGRYTRKPWSTEAIVAVVATAIIAVIIGQLIAKVLPHLDQRKEMHPPAIVEQP